MNRKGFSTIEALISAVVVTAAFLATVSTFSIAGGKFRSMQIERQLQPIQDSLRVQILNFADSYLGWASNVAPLEKGLRKPCDTASRPLDSRLIAGTQLPLSSPTHELTLLNREKMTTFKSQLQDLAAQSATFQSALNRCRIRQTVYDVELTDRFGDFSDQKNLYFCFLLQSQEFSVPVLVEALYLPYIPDNEALTCRQFSDAKFSLKRLGMLNYSLYWANEEKGKLAFHVKRGTWAGGSAH